MTHPETPTLSDQVIDDLRAENEHLRAMVEWQLIETAPTDGTEIIVYSCGDIFTAAYLKSHITNDAPFFVTTAAGEPWDCSGSSYKVEHEYRRGISHWMHLPPSPRGNQQ